MESYAKSKKLPFILKKLALLIRIVLCCLFETTTIKKINQDPEISIKKTQVIDETVEPNKSVMKTKQELSEPINVSKKCNNCNRCDKCEAEHLKEKQKKDDQKEHDLNLSALNMLMFCVEFIFILSCNTTIWLKISN